MVNYIYIIGIVFLILVLGFIVWIIIHSSTKQCKNDSDCSTDQYCNNGTCDNKCSDSNPCPTNQTCNLKGVCINIPKCTDNTKCTSVQYCDTDAGTCVNKCTVGSCSDGLNCDTISGRCLQPFSDPIISTGYYTSNQNDVGISWDGNTGNTNISLLCVPSILSITANSYNIKVSFNYNYNPDTVGDTNPAFVVQFFKIISDTCDQSNIDLNDNTIVNDNLDQSNTQYSHIINRGTSGIFRFYITTYVLLTNVTPLALQIQTIS